MTSGKPKRDVSCWRCPCGKPLEPSAVMRGFWKCRNGHRWIEEAESTDSWQTVWKRVGLPTERGRAWREESERSERSCRPHAPNPVRTPTGGTP